MCTTTQALLTTIAQSGRGYPVQHNDQPVPSYLSSLCPAQSPFLLSPVNQACLEASLHDPFSVPGVQEAFLGSSGEDCLRFEKNPKLSFFSPAKNAPSVLLRQVQVIPGINVNIRSSSCIQVLQEKITAGPFGAFPGDRLLLPQSTYAPDGLVMAINVADDYLDNEPSTANLSHFPINAAIISLSTKRPSSLCTRTSSSGGTLLFSAGHRVHVDKLQAFLEAHLYKRKSRSAFFNVCRMVDLDVASIFNIGSNLH